MSGPTLTFLGAAGAVTGSKFLLQTDRARVLVECGLYQGLREFRRRNWEPFPVDPASLDAVVLSHAHLDHTGYLPRLVREGFSGPVVCTRHTALLSSIVLRDSAHLQEEEAALANAAGWSKHHPALPLYGAADVEKALSLLDPAPVRQQVGLARGVEVVLRPAGHILGSATVGLDVEGHRLLFTGDLGRPHHPLLRPPDDPPPCDTVVLESTYGDRSHPPPDPDRLADAIVRTVGRGGVVLIPAFAVDRTELVLISLRRLMRSGRIPRLPVYVDSPMATAALDVYRGALVTPDPEIRPECHGSSDVFDTGDLRVARTAEESQRLNRPAASCIIVSASGMATGGRVVHHLKHQLPDPRNTVVLTGYQAQGTRGRQLREGAREVKIHGRYVQVRAEVVDVEDFSVHADADEMLHWLSAMPGAPGTAYVVHGEPEAAAHLATRVEDDLDWCAVVPRHGEQVLVD